MLPFDWTFPYAWPHKPACACSTRAETLRLIAESGGESFYCGQLAERIEAFAVRCGGALRVADLAVHEAEWVEPIGQSFRGFTLHEIPPMARESPR